MKVRKLLPLCLLSFLLAACGAGGDDLPELEATLPSISFQSFQDGNFQAVVPGWEESPELDPDTIFMAHQEGQFIAINRYLGIPQMIAAVFRSHINEDPGAYLVLDEVRNGKPFFEYTTREENQTSRVQVALDYCQGYTYAVAAGGRESVQNADLFQQVLASSSCQDPYSVPDLPTGKIGLMVNPARDDYQEGFYPALRLAKQTGVQVIHSYLSWGEVEPNAGERIWEWQDALMGYRIQEGFEISLVVNLIHTNLRGPLPEDLQEMDFDDPEFISRFSTFILEVLERYPVQYLSLGNEVNDYFVSHRDEIAAYQTFFLAVKEDIQQEYPDVQVAMTFAYHDAESSNALDIIQQLNLGDFLPVTLYLYKPGFKFERDPAELEGYLERILDLADGKSIAFAEIGWNTAESLGGSQLDQEEFVRETFRLLALHRDEIEYVGWFSLHDSLIENATQAALTFLPPNAPQIRDEVFMRDFIDFLNYTGLIANDGSPKLGWFAFQEEASLYLEQVQEQD